MKNLMIFFFYIGSLIPLYAQDTVESDSVKQITTYTSKEISTKELQEIAPDSLIMQGFEYSNLQHAVSKGDIVRINYFHEDVIEVFFKNFQPVIIPEYFLFGALGSKKMYQERNLLKSKESSDKMDNYPFVNYLRYYIRQTFGVEVAVGENERGLIHFYSPKLAPVMNKFFHKKTGEVNFDLFKTNEEICSYLLGMYYRSGKKLDTQILSDYLYSKEEYTTVYEFSSFNISIDRLFYLLRKVGANNIVYTSTSRRGYAPGKTYLFFEPYPYLESYFKTIETEKEILEKFNAELLKEHREKQSK